MNATSNHPRNSFNAVRLFAAWSVLWSHSYVLTGADPDPLLKSLGMSGGHVAVDVFFFISGLLISGSIDRGTPWPVFLKNRALRIFPGLWVMLLVTCSAYVLATILHRDAVSWDSVLRYLVRNGSLVSSELQYALGSLFEDNPYPKVVNGSLWTLPWELRMYALLAMTGYLLHSVRQYAYTLLAIAGWFIWHFGSSFASTGLLSFPDPWRFMYFFFLGALVLRGVQLHSGQGLKARRWWPVAALALVVAVANTSPNLTVVLYSAALPAFVIGIGYTWLGSGVVAKVISSNDLSYGTYLYAFPIQQLIVATTPNLSATALTLLATVPTFAMAWLSWRYVEERALSKKSVTRPITNGLATRKTH